MDFLMQLSVEALTALVSLLAVGVPALVKAFKFINEGELGIKLRFGKALRDKEGKPKIISPGFVLLIPWVETLERHHVRQQTIRFANQKIMLKDGLIFNVTAVVIFRVSDIYKALFEIDELDDSISDLGMGLLRDELSPLDHDELADIGSISEKLLACMKEKADEWGVVFLQFKLTDCAPTPETAHLLNAEVGARLKVEALQKAIKGNGHEPFDLGTVDPGLAAVLVGIPLVATTTVNAVTKKKP